MEADVAAIEFPSPRLFLSAATTKDATRYSRRVQWLVV